jgi:hypothetical protein
MYKKQNKINAVVREGVGRFTGLPLWTGWREKGGYLPLILPLISADGFCLSKYRRWDTRFVECVHCAGEAYCMNSFSSVGNVHLFCCTIKAFKQCPSTSQDDWEQHYIIPLCGKQFAHLRMLFFLLCVQVSGVGGVPQLDKPCFPGSAIYLGGDVGIFITSSFTERWRITFGIIRKIHFILNFNFEYNLQKVDSVIASVCLSVCIWKGVLKSAV